ncbi:MAG: response regulator [Betaproteobacteria bacterium]|nr:response regulator [Betaproteobacteria bacterium]
MLPQYNYWLVLVSIFVASLASYTALDLASRITASKGPAARAWLVGGAVAMGTGIWSMHFIGMLALRLPIALGYEWLTTFLSLLIAIVVSFFALYIVSRHTLTWGRLAVSGFTMGIGIVSMHYVGMHALRLSPPITYDPWVVAASVAIAAGASTAGLWAAFKLRHESRWTQHARIGGGVILGLAISGMHYTGMAAANFAPDAVCLSSSLMDTPWVSGAVTVFTLLILSATLLLSLIDSRMAAKTAEMTASLNMATQENRAKDEFLAMLAHELRNPLAAISNAIYVLDASEPRSSGWQFARDVIGRQTTHLNRMIDDLLDLGRVVSGKIALETCSMDLNESVQHALASSKASGKAAKHDLVYSGVPVHVNGDRTRIEQIVTNLVSNALTYTREGGRIEVSVMQEGTDAVLTVRDTGIGIASDVMPHVFELFFQGRQGVYRSTRGLGIGLTLVRRLVEMHGGTVEAYSAGLGKGAVFTVRLPAIEQRRPAPVDTATRRAQHAHRSVVIVEDDADACETLRMALEMEGHSVVTAEDGLAGLDKIRNMQPDVGIIDIGLPRLNGYQIAQRLRSQSDRIFLVALTGYGTQDDHERAKSAGFDAHLTKPADLAALTELIATAPMAR